MEEESRIGIVGGLGPASTELYYRMVCREYNRRRGGLRFPPLVLRSLDMATMVPLFRQGEWDAVADRIADAIDDLAAAGAEFAAIAANTPHQAFVAISRRSRLPVLSITEPIADALARAGHRRVGLVGTRATMEGDFYERALTERDIQTRTPEAAVRSWIDDLVWGELARGEPAPESRTEFERVLRDLSEGGAEALVLACTEFSLLVPRDPPAPIFDTTTLHVQAIVEAALGVPPEGQA